VEIFIPLYLRALLYPIDHELPIHPARGFPLVKIRLDEHSFRSRIYTTCLPDANVKVHLVDSDTYEYFTSRSALVSPYAFNDNFDRFAYFCKVVSKVCALRPDVPDIVHAHDWPTGFVPMFMSTEYGATRIASVFTIHNLGFSNALSPEKFYKVTRLRDAEHPGLYDWRGRGILHHGQVDMLKAGIVRADMVNTVSPTYAREILDPAYGGDYADTLRYVAERGQLRGILNGVDPMWRPTLPPDDFLPRKAEWKRELQGMFALPEEPGVFLVAMTSRLARQKGYQLLPDAMRRLSSQGVRLQLVASVDGDADLREALLSCASPTVDVRHRPYNEDLTRSFVYPGADALLMPSLYEPCGLSQIIAQLNGTPPVVFATGGLKDTVDDGHTGFVFQDHTGEALARAVERAQGLFYGDPAAWDAMRRRVMELDRSWRRPAEDYVGLYLEAIERAHSDRRFA
jgi:starch synthase